MQKKDIIDAYCTIRKIDNTIPDDVLDFMKDSSLTMLDKEIIVADLRNKINPIYNLANLILATKERPDLLDLVYKEGELCLENKYYIKNLLDKLDKI